MNTQGNGKKPRLLTLIGMSERGLVLHIESPNGDPRDVIATAEFLLQIIGPMIEEEIDRIAADKAAQAQAGDAAQADALEASLSTAVGEAAGAEAAATIDKLMAAVKSNPGVKPH